MSIRRQKDIAQLDVAVDDALPVDVVNDRGKFHKPLKDAVLVEFCRIDVRERTRTAALGQDNKI